MKQASKNITVRSIAKQLGLSPATVSIALNGGRPISFVSSATRKQVWEVAKELGYPLERLRSNRALLERVAVFMSTGPNPVYSETALALCRCLPQSRVQTHIITSDQEAYASAAALFHRQEVDGVVFLGSRSELPTLDAPYVIVGDVPPDTQVWQVRADNEGGGRAVGTYLWSLGHRSVGLIMPAHRQPAGERRIAGIGEYWREKGRSLADVYLWRVDTGQFYEAELRDIAGRIQASLRESEPVTALFCFNDWIAGQMLKILRGQGVRVPEEISVVGFDDSIYADLLDPALTTVHNPFDTLGTLAAELLLEQVENPDAAPRTLVADCPLIERRSCANLLLTSSEIA